jgi:hypothetical protein
MQEGWMDEWMDVYPEWFITCCTNLPSRQKTDRKPQSCQASLTSWGTAERKEKKRKEKKRKGKPAGGWGRPS